MPTSPIRYAVLGAAGQLGSDLCRQLTGQVAGLTHAEADLTQPELLRQSLTDLRPEVVFNCAAYNSVDRAEQEPEAACAVNAWGVRHLAHICRDLGCTLVHFSTDYVFGLDDGRRTPYVEADAPGPASVYGLSKLAGEYQVRSLCPRHYVIRTCGLYGAWGRGGKGTNFVETMLRLGQQGKPLRVVNDQVCTPSYTADVAGLAIKLVATQLYGLYHATNSDCCSWFDFARQIFERALLRVDISPISSKDYGAAARRPAYSVLESQGLKKANLSPLRSWQEALQAYLLERQVARSQPAASSP